MAEFCMTACFIQSGLEHGIFSHWYFTR